ncbi:hypothetical protein ACTG9Q_28705 [Actinokineospora sp. 24-640]
MLKLLTIGVAMTLSTSVVTACTTEQAIVSVKPLEAEPRQWAGPVTQEGILYGADQHLEGWDGGYVTGVGSGRGVFALAVSSDGREWREVTLEGAIDLAVLRPVAAHGSQAYALGWTSEALTVWRTEDGRTWQAETLSLGSTHFDVGHAEKMSFTIAAGPQGVVVAGSYDFYPPEGVGALVWHSPDGKTFRPVVIPGSTDSSFFGDVKVSAIAEGFLATVGSGRELYQSRNGLNWVRIPISWEGELIEYAAASGPRLVVFTRSYKTLKYTPRYLIDGTWHNATLDPGRLPDAGVVPATEHEVEVVRQWGSGFIALGHVRLGEGVTTSAMVWHSRDGIKWNRMPVRSNGFDRVWTFMDLAVRGGEAMITGYSYDGTTEWLHTWNAAVPIP